MARPSGPRGHAPEHIGAKKTARKSKSWIYALFATRYIHFIPRFVKKSSDFEKKILTHKLLQNITVAYENVKCYNY